MSLPDLCLLCFVPGDGVEPVFPGGVCVVEALLLLWNKLSWSVLHFAGAYSDAGGGRGMVLLRSPRLVCLPLQLRLVGWLLAFFCFKGAEQDVGLVEVRRVDQARASLGGGVRRRQAVVQERRSSGRVPGRWAFGDAFISSMWMSVHCDYSQSLAALGFLTIRARRSSGDGVRWRLPAAAGGFSWRTGGVDGPRDLVVFLLFVRGLSVKFLFYISFPDVSVFVWTLYP